MATETRTWLTQEERRLRSVVAIDQVRNGQSIAVVAAKHGLSAATLRSYCFAAGLSFAKPKLPKRPYEAKPRFSNYRVLAILINTPRSLRDIADEFGVTPQSVQIIADRARKHGIKLHPKRKMA